MSFTTFKKYFLPVAGVFLLCFAVIVVILSVLINSYTADQKFKYLNSTCDIISDYSSGRFSSSAFRHEIFSVSRAATENNGDIIIITNEAGNIISCSCDSYSESGNCPHESIVINTETLNEVAIGKYNKLGKLDNVFVSMHYLAAKPILSEQNNVVGYVFAASDASSQTSLYRDIFRILYLSAFLPIIVMFFALYAITLRWSRPLKKISAAAIAIAEGDFTKTVPVNGNDEIAELCKSFNNMTDSLRELEDMRRGFIGNVSHELKTPMTTIGGFIEGIMDGTVDDDKKEHYLNLVSQEIKRLSRLVDNMLSLSKLEAGETQINIVDFDFKLLIFDVLFSQEQLIEGKQLSIDGLDGLDSCFIEGDKGLLHQVVYNLCDNAVKFTPEKGNISFRLEKNADNIIFKIKNSGDGISQADLPKIFDRFYKGDKARSKVKNSTGLGLYLVKTIVKIHNGKVFVSSVENEYSEFGAVLPIKYKKQ